MIKYAPNGKNLVRHTKARQVKYPLVMAWHGQPPPLAITYNELVAQSHHPVVTATAARCASPMPFRFAPQLIPGSVIIPGRPGHHIDIREPSPLATHTDALWMATDRSDELDRLRDASNEYIYQQSVADPIIYFALQFYTRGADAAVNRLFRTAMSSLASDAEMDQVRSMWTQPLPIPAWMQEGTPKWGIATHGEEKEGRYIDWFRKEYNDPNWQPTVGFVVRALRRAMRHAPHTKIPLTLYRGVKTQLPAPACRLLAAPEMALNQAYFTEQGLMSTTGYSTVAAVNNTDPESGCCLMVVHVPAATRILNLEELSEFLGEDEFLLGPHVMMKVTRISNQNDEVHYGVMEERVGARHVFVVQPDGTTAVKPVTDWAFPPPFMGVVYMAEVTA